AGLSFNADGSYSFDASSYDALNAGEELVLTIAFTATDENAATSASANLVITITGTNDTPVATAAVAAVAEDAGISGNVSATDADTGETAALTYALVDPAPAGLSFNADGSYSFDASSYDALNAGEELVLTVAFTATDENAATSAPANLVITITGTNDTPVAAAAVAAVTEDAGISGNVSATDADTGETATLTYALVDPAPAGLSFNADGSYSFDASSYDALNAGEELVLTIAFTATDENAATSAPANLVITVTGTNDTPVAAAAVAAVAEDAGISGNVSATDADAGETATLTYALVDPAPAGLSFNADGSYSFDASSYDALNAGEELVLTIAFTATDENAATSASANLVITVTGTNDIPVATAAVAAVTEDAGISGNVSATDADAGETATLTYALVDPAPAGLIFNADGSYSFDASSYDALNAGEELVLTIAFTATDENAATSASANLVITITGTNDTPVATAAVAAVAEDAGISGNVSATDADAGETAALTYALVDPAPAGLSFNADGSYSFDASSYDALNAGEELVLTIAFTATDENAATSAPANLVITVTGTNDTPVATAAVAAVTEDAGISGNVSATDADAGETAALTYALVDPAPAGLSFNADGSYSFDASSYDALNAGEELVLTIAFTATDENAATSAPANLVITVTGTNDTPVATAAVAAVTEDAGVSGNVSATDADAGETATLTYALVDPAPAGLSFNADGSYSFDAS
ncbi:VCBS domain-containing protein, partial [Bradyrhizobium sp. AUGA SZCCT0431]|uniref:VCBS domain-containing protein n=1 Tax=Bradyrhizobium sp. AUGA SZCCT0431 TaxID=2807674 RepID=UPI001BA7293D